MSNLFQKIIAGFLSALFSLRYRIKVVGLNELKKEHDPKGGFIFLPNHPTLLIDPVIIATTIARKMVVRPVVVDFMYYLKLPHILFRWMKAIPIPSFSVTTNTHKLRRMDRALDEVVKGLDKGENFLFYPAGKIKLTAKEQIGGASGLNKILKDTKHYNVVLVRITGLWGSSFSRAHPDHASNMTTNVWNGIKSIFKNLIFFTPRRDVLIEFVPAPPDFPYNEARTVQNRWLENWYNKTVEEVYFVPYSLWSKQIPNHLSREVEDEEHIDLEKVPALVRQKIIDKLSEMSDIPARNIHPNMSLATDLGIDSLDAAEIAIFLEEQFEVKDVPGDDLTTVKKIFGVASRQIKIEGSDEMKFDFSKWNVPHEAKEVQLSHGETLEEVFLNTCARLRKSVSCADERMGVLSYQDLLLRTLLLSEKFKALPGKYVGILLPSSVGAMVLFFALQLAGKIPVMINWTIGARHVNAVIDATDLKVCLSSWGFLDRLSNVDLGRLVDCLVQLEDMKESISLKDQLNALWMSKQSVSSLSKYFKLDKKSGDDTAVLLFTSGSEGNPKGVPLSHTNVLTNLKGVISAYKLYENDVFFSILPPFHSFGFTICGMAPLLLGVKAIFHPNPTDGTKIAKGIERWKATIVCGAPSFLKNIFKSAIENQLISLRLVVTGAEKAPDELYQMAQKAGIGEALLEGYGITECSPVLTLNHPGEERKGVGRPVAGVELDIIDPDSHEKVGINQQGLILASGLNVFAGYLNPSSNPFVRREGKNWYITGDLGYLDEKGRLTITGRLKRFVKVGPEMISLGAIEEAIAEQKDKLGPIPMDEGPLVAVCAKEVPGEKPRFYLFTTFPLTVEKANVLLKQVGFSNLVRIHHVHTLPKIPLMGSGKTNYQLIENEFLAHIHQKETGYHG